MRTFAEGTPLLAIVTDARIGEGLLETGWVDSLATKLQENELEELKESIGNSSLAGLLGRTQLIRIAWEVSVQTTTVLAQGFNTVRAVAQLIHAELFQAVARVASANRDKDRASALSISVGDLQALAHRVMETVNLDHLEAAVRQGIVAPVDFLSQDDIAPERFLAGVDVHPAHIATGLDLPRPRELGAILTGLKQDRYSLIVGPSGSGKSALLWRTAKELDGAVRVFRIYRITTEDCESLIHWVRLQDPSTNSPLLLCADDLGRPHTEAWPIAAHKLLEIPGTLLLGASRQENFQPRMVMGQASVVEPQMDQTLAFEISKTLEDRGVAPRLDVAEAFEESRGLLMEYQPPAC